MVQVLERQQQDQWIVQRGIPWERFKKIQEGFTGCPNVRLFYLDGTLEILRVARSMKSTRASLGC